MGAHAVPDRQHVREVLATVAQKAREKLPASVNGRLESAVALVLMGDVQPNEDGTITVYSATDATRCYVLQGVTCTCTDFTQEKAPAGWCKHRIAAGLQKRLTQVLEAENPPQSTAVETGPLPEAPASVNVHLTIEGRDVQLTLRDTDEGRLLARLTAVLAEYPAPQPPAQPQGPPQDGSWCGIHQVQMALQTKDGRSWRSHWCEAEQRWCKGKPGR